jgi:hypothetical protein
VTHQLRFQLELVPHPYPHEIAAPTEAWGRLTAVIENDGETERLFETTYPLDLLAEWYADHCGELCSVPLPEAPQAGESLAEAFDRFMSRDFTDEAAAEAWFDQLYDFREMHYVPSWLRGASLPPVIVGCTDDAGEISFYLDTEIPQADLKRLVADTGLLKTGNWSYAFDMNQFQSDLQAEIQAFLSTWMDTTPYEEGKARAGLLLGRIGA